MERRRFGPTAVEIPVIGQGTWYIDKANRGAAVAALRLGLDLGMTHIDTAEYYGEAENIVGEAIAGRRADVFLVSKVVPEHATRAGAITACEHSLSRLKTDRLDCYLLHWRGRHPLEETVAGFEQLYRDGKIRSFGVSNFDVEDLEEIWAITDGIVCNQVLYNLEERTIEHAVLPWCEAHDVAITAYSPFGHDNFPGPGTVGGAMLARIAKAHSATPRQIALAFLTRRASTFAIPKAASSDHAKENAEAGDIHLTATEIAHIDAAFPRGTRRATLPML
ncbi:MAG: aldo/keto reductase [Roseiarcus sp.]|uniref:aldo/keto reductase n=1 Tax=Roseiarcus sp. TaxID=1969460 RepID=UPI003C3B8BE3